MLGVATAASDEAERHSPEPEEKLQESLGVPTDEAAAAENSDLPEDVPADGVSVEDAPGPGVSDADMGHRMMRSLTRASWLTEVTLMAEKIDTYFLRCDQDRQYCGYIDEQEGKPLTIVTCFKYNHMRIIAIEMAVLFLWDGYLRG